MKTFKYALLTAFILSSVNLNSQVLISLLFGDKLNSPKIEFGLIGGENVSDIRGISNTKALWSFNLGFYFHINLKNQTYASTGVLVKSNVGAKGMPTYPVGDPEFDEVFMDGELTKQINYFYVPILIHQRFNNRWYIEGGFQAGLRSKVYDIFELEASDGDLEYKTKVGDQYSRFDFGLMGGGGYKFKKQTKSIAIGFNYYYGLVDVSKVEGTSIKNSSWYLYIKIPIGAGKSQAKAEAKAAEGQGQEN